MKRELQQAKRQGQQDRQRRRGFLDRYKDPSKAQAYREGYYAMSVRECRELTGHAEVKGKGFCACTHAMYVED